MSKLSDKKKLQDRFSCPYYHYFFIWFKKSFTTELNCWISDSSGEGNENLDLYSPFHFLTGVTNLFDCRCKTFWLPSKRFLASGQKRLELDPCRGQKTTNNKSFTITLWLSEDNVVWWRIFQKRIKVLFFGHKTFLLDVFLDGHAELFHADAYIS